MAGLLDLLNTPDMRLGLGLLAAGGPTPQRMNTGQRLFGLLGQLSAEQRAEEERKAQQEERAQRARMSEAQLQSLLEQQAAARKQRETQANDEGLIRRTFSPLPGPTQDGAPLMRRFDPASLLQEGASLGGVQQAMALNQAMQKPAVAPMKLSPGERVYDPATGREMFGAPEKAEQPKPTDLARMLQEMNALPEDSPLRALYQKQIAKMITHAPGVSVSYGAPVAGIDPQGNPVFFQPDKGGGAPAIIPGVAPPPRETPASMREKMAQNNVTLGKIDKALNEVEKRPGSFGAQNYLPDPVMQRMDPEGVAGRAMIADIAGQKIHDRSGAAVTVGEAERLKPYIPAATDHPDTVRKKLALFREEYRAMMQELNSGATLAQSTASRASTAEQPVRRYNPRTGRIE